MNWAPAGHRVAPPGTTGGNFPVEAAINELERALRDLDFIETAEGLACDRMTVLRQMIAACKEEIAEQDAATQEELSQAIAELGAELSGLEETRTLESAFRADQRDRAREGLEQAQEVLRRFLDDPSDAIGAFDPTLPLDDAIERAEAALARAPTHSPPSKP